jgi:hypothetical protein
VVFRDYGLLENSGLLRDFRLLPLSVQEPFSGLLRMSSGNSLPTLRDNLLVPSSVVYESGTYRFFRKVCEELPLFTRNNLEEHRSQKDLLAMTVL